MSLLPLLGLAFAAGPAVRDAEVSPARLPASPTPAGLIRREWPFCPSDRLPCDGGANPPWWVRLDVDPDAFTQRSAAPHDSPRLIVDTTRADLRPLAEAVERALRTAGHDDPVLRAAVVQGLVQSVPYRYDQTTTWTEYPKFGLEMIVDEAGDCDDAAILSVSLMLELGLSPAFVHWEAADPGAKGGHLSSAVPAEGPFAAVSPPKGSPLVVDPASGRRYLHTDGVGAVPGPGGASVCTTGCSELGWNGWPSSQPPLKVDGVVPGDAPDLDTRLDTRAFRNGTFGIIEPDVPAIDRRGQPAADILGPVRREPPPPAATVARLEHIGLEPTVAARYADPEVEEAGWWLLSGLGCAGIGAVVGGGWVATLERRRRAAALRARREAARF